MRDELKAEVETLEEQKAQYEDDNNDESTYEAKIQELKDDLAAAKEEYKKIQADNKAKQKPQQETHEKAVELQEEYSKLKRQLIALKNGKSVGSGGQNENQAVQLTKSQEAYKNAQKTEEKRH